MAIPFLGTIKFKGSVILGGALTMAISILWAGGARL
jgi:hypothetical protein